MSGIFGIMEQLIYLNAEMVSASPESHFPHPHRLTPFGAYPR